jgi:hypothetical protein
MIKDVQYVGSHPKKIVSMDSWYVTGFADGEGCFSVSFSKRNKMTTGIEIRPSFSISQNKRSLEALKLIQAYFGCGGIRFSSYDQTYEYEVRSLSDLLNLVIPHFEKYPLQTSKRQDFEKFLWICQQIRQSKHLNKETLITIIDTAYLMNESGKRRYTKNELLTILGEKKI